MNSNYGSIQNQSFKLHEAKIVTYSRKRTWDKTEGKDGYEEVPVSSDLNPLRLVVDRLMTQSEQI